MTDEDRAAEARRGGRVYRILANDPQLRAGIDDHVATLRAQGALLPGDRWMGRPPQRPPGPRLAPQPKRPKRAPVPYAVRRQPRARFQHAIAALQRLPLSLLACDPVMLTDLTRREARLDRAIFLRSWLCDRGRQCPEHRLLRAVFR